MTELNMLLMKRFAEHADTSLTSDTLLQYPRAVSTDSEAKEWLKQCELVQPSELALQASAQFALLKKGSDTYLVVVGLEPAVPIDADLKVEALNSGAFTYIAATLLRFPIQQFSDLAPQIHEFVFTPYVAPEGNSNAASPSVPPPQGKEGLNNKLEEKAPKLPPVLLQMEAVRRLLYPIKLYKVAAGSALLLGEAVAYRIGVIATVMCRDLTVLKWPEKVLSLITDMALDRDEKAPFHLLFRMMHEPRGEAAFLSLYRCIEQLFPLPKVADLKDFLGLQKPAVEVAAAIEHYLGWRRQEIESLQHIIRDIADEKRAQLASFFGVEPGEVPVARALYSLRNQCVHYRPLHAKNVVQYSEEKWIELVALLLEVVQELYEKHSDAFENASVTLCEFP